MQPCPQYPAAAKSSHSPAVISINWSKRQQWSQGRYQHPQLAAAHAAQRYCIAMPCRELMHLCLAQLGGLLRLLQLMAALHGAAPGGGSRLWGPAVDSQLRSLSAALQLQQEQRLGSPGASRAPGDRQEDSISGEAAPADTAEFPSEETPLAPDDLLGGATSGDDHWAELEDKIRRQGGVESGSESRARQLRQCCLVLLKDMILAPSRGKKD